MAVASCRSLSARLVIAAPHAGRAKCAQRRAHSVLAGARAIERKGRRGSGSDVAVKKRVDSVVQVDGHAIAPGRPHFGATCVGLPATEGRRLSSAGCAIDRGLPRAELELDDFSMGELVQAPEKGLVVGFARPEITSSSRLAPSRTPALVWCAASSPPKPSLLTRPAKYNEAPAPPGILPTVEPEPLRTPAEGRRRL